MHLQKMVYAFGLFMIGGVLLYLMLVGPGQLTYEVPVGIRMDPYPSAPSAQPNSIPPAPRERRIQVFAPPPKGTPILLVPDPESLRTEVQALGPLRVLDPSGMDLVALHPLRKGLPCLLGISIEGFREGDRLRLRVVRGKGVGVGKGEREKVWEEVRMRVEGTSGEGTFALPRQGEPSELWLEWVGERRGRKGRVQRHFSLRPGPPPRLFAPSALKGTALLRALSQAGFTRVETPEEVDLFVLPLDLAPEPGLLKAVDAGMGVLLVPGGTAHVASGWGPLLPARLIDAVRPKAEGKSAPIPSKTNPSKKPPKGGEGTPEKLSPKEKPLEEPRPGKGSKKKAHSVGMVLLVDNSSSMKYEGRNLLAGKAALESALRLGRGDSFSLISFGQRPRILLPIGPAFRTVSLRRALRGLDASGGLTNGYPAVIAAWKQLKRSPASIRHVVLVTDGIFTDIGRDFSKIFRAMKREGIGLTVIAIHASQNDAVSDLDVRTFLPLKTAVEAMGWTFLLTNNARRIPRLVLGEVETLRRGKKKLVLKQPRFTKKPPKPKERPPKKSPPKTVKKGFRLEIQDPLPLLAGLENVRWPNPKRVLPFRPRPYAMVPLLLQPGGGAFEAAGPYGLGRVLLIAGGLDAQDSLPRQSWFRKWMARSASWLLNPDPPSRLRGRIVPSESRILEGEGLPRTLLDRIARRTGGKVVEQFSPAIQSLRRARQAPWWPWLLGCALGFLLLAFLFRS